MPYDQNNLSFVTRVEDFCYVATITLLVQNDANISPKCLKKQNWFKLRANVSTLSQQ